VQAVLARSGRRFRIVTACRAWRVLCCDALGGSSCPQDGGNAIRQRRKYQAAKPQWRANALMRTHSTFASLAK